MKILTAAFVLAASATAALAQQALPPLKPGQVPTGIYVSGRTEYVMPPGTYAVVQVDCERPETYFKPEFANVCRSRLSGGESGTSVAK